MTDAIVPTPTVFPTVHLNGTGRDTMTTPHPHPKILTLAQKKRAVTESLFKPINGRSLACMPNHRFDRGKYRRNMAGEPVPEHMLEIVALVWCERRKDRDGPYYALFSLHMPKA